MNQEKPYFQKFPRFARQDFFPLSIDLTENPAKIGRIIFSTLRYVSEKYRILLAEKILKILRGGNRESEMKGKGVRGR